MGRRILSTATAFMVGVGLVISLFWIISACTPRSQDGLLSYARGEIAQLQVLSEPPAQPDGVLNQADGSEVRLSDYRGRVLLVNLWATWCAPCLRELPSIDRLAGRMSDEDFAVAAISLDGVREDAVAWFEENGIENFGPLHDPEITSFARALGAPGLPVTIIYDPRGRELARLSGDAEWDSPEAVALIEAVITRSATVAADGNDAAPS